MDDITPNLESMPHGLGAMEGTPAYSALFEHPQQENFDCVEASIADVVNETTGSQLTDEDVVRQAEGTTSAFPDPTTGAAVSAYDPSSGTHLQDAPKLLAADGVDAFYTDDHVALQGGAAVGMDALQNELTAGHRVIVSVDAPKIWDAIGVPHDQPDPNTGDHAVVVTGVDTTNQIVYVNDTGHPDGAAEAVPLSVFEQAWAVGNHAMVSTDSPHSFSATLDPSAVPGPSSSVTPFDPFSLLAAGSTLSSHEGVRGLTLGDQSSTAHVLTQPADPDAVLGGSHSLPPRADRIETADQLDGPPTDSVQPSVDSWLPPRADRIETADQLDGPPTDSVQPSVDSWLPPRADRIETADQLDGPPTDSVQPSVDSWLPPRADRIETADQLDSPSAGPSYPSHSGYDNTNVASNDPFAADPNAVPVDPSSYDPFAADPNAVPVDPSSYDPFAADPNAVPVDPSSYDPFAADPNAVPVDPSSYDPFAADPNAVPVDPSSYDPFAADPNAVPVDPSSYDPFAADPNAVPVDPSSYDPFAADPNAVPVDPSSYDPFAADPNAVPVDPSSYDPFAATSPSPDEQLQFDPVSGNPYTVDPSSGEPQYLSPQTDPSTGAPYVVDPSTNEQQFLDPRTGDPTSGPEYSPSVAPTIDEPSATDPSSSNIPSSTEPSVSSPESIAPDVADSQPSESAPAPVESAPAPVESAPSE